MRKIGIVMVLAVLAAVLLHEGTRQKTVAAPSPQEPPTASAPTSFKHCEVTPLLDGDYFPVLHEALQGAKKSILCVMYRASYGKNPKHRERILVEDLVEAHRRLVQRVLALESSKPA
jgi:hypothetical protein